MNINLEMFEFQFEICHINFRFCKLNFKPAALIRVMSVGVIFNVVNCFSCLEGNKNTPQKLHPSCWAFLVKRENLPIIYFESLKFLP